MLDDFAPRLITCCNHKVIILVGTEDQCEKACIIKSAIYEPNYYLYALNRQCLYRQQSAIGLEGR